MAPRCASTAWRAAAVALIGIRVTSGCGFEREPPAGATAATVAAVERTASCTDGDRVWAATVTDTADPTRVRLTAAAHPSGWEERSPWWLVTTDPDTRARVERAVDAGTVAGIDLDVAEAPRLVSPDGRCTIYLVRPAAPGTTSLVIIGDSLAAGMVASEPARAQLRSDAAARALHLLVDGQSGAPWTALVAEGENLEDEMRGALSIERAGVVATVLGANDAILAAMTPAPDRQSQRDRTDAAIRTMIDAARRDGRCVVLTTPPDVPIEAFALGDAYVDEARRVGEHLRAIAATDPGVVVVDFAAVSRSHHLPDGTAGDWFGDDDQLHPNTDGSAALGALLLDAADHCRAVS